MPDLRELYQEVIIDHGRHPRHFGMLASANYHKEGFNPLCGDKIILHIEKINNIIKKIYFEGSGCAISMASASLLTEVLAGKNVSEIELFFTAFHQLMITGNTTEDLGKLAVLSGVHAFPARIKCATLAWHTLKAALNQSSDPVSTEETI